MCWLAIWTWYRKSLNSSNADASFGGIFGQFAIFFSKLVVIIAGWPNRSLRIVRACFYALSGSCTRYWSCSLTLLDLPSKYWYNKCSFCVAVTGIESIKLSIAFSHWKNFVWFCSFPLNTSGLAVSFWLKCHWNIAGNLAVEGCGLNRVTGWKLEDFHKKPLDELSPGLPVQGVA